MLKPVRPGITAARVHSVSSASEHCCEHTTVWQMTVTASHRPPSIFFHQSPWRRRALAVPLSSPDTARGHERRDDGSFNLPSQQTGLPATSRVIYDAVKIYTYFFLSFFLLQLGSLWCLGYLYLLACWDDLTSRKGTAYLQQSVSVRPASLRLLLILHF